jgi:tetratricopeptide (TPR) repeat protein
MTVPTSLSRAIAVCILWLGWSAAFADSGSISGTVRDQTGKQLANVAIYLVCNHAPTASRRTTTGNQGEFHFIEVVFGEYTLRAELTGYANDENPRVLVSLGSAEVTVNLTLKPASSGGTQATGKPAGPPPQLQASGLRGLIDPGGYSASANSSAATGLLKGIADVRRTGDSTEISAKDLPCDLEPELRKAVEETPNQENNRKLGEFYVVHGQVGKGIPFLMKAWQLGSTDYLSSDELGVALLRNAQFEEARKLFSAMVEHDDLPDVHRHLAQAEEGLAMFQQAAQEYRKAQSEQPGEDNLFAVGYELLLAGLPSDALTVYREGSVKYPQSIRIRIGEGTAQFLLGHSVESLHIFLEAADLDASDPRTYPFLAAASSVSGEEKTRVIASFYRFLELAPENASANYFYALALSREPGGENADRIESLLKTAIRIHPSSSKAHLLLANTYAGRNNYSGAIPEYEAAIRLDPNLSESHYRLAAAYKRVGRSEDSAREQQTFQAIRAREFSKSGKSELDLSQFISVMNAPTKSNEAAKGCAPVQR